ncbi:SusC/RagA family TonB-linked outer membrane protein [Seonamhaeicola marinus]|uniref:TonB-dependent receptor n=1 Tax=Seonamhaeicola marinus TaxID=1912246 RepID=A0A5D0J992_9FLAO|nr:TonB-dependent receptor [Seonamhaeicola marinus]TYA92146.1 TonB-dependent receptor [Seonamhaeicola marinus]
MKIKLLERSLFKGWQFKVFLIALICSISFNSAYAQTKTLKGQVTGAGEPLAGATVIVVGTSTGAITDFDGNYEIKAAPGNKLQFSYLGFVDKVITLGNQTSLNVSLQEDLSTLDEVVVVGYGTQKKKELTGAVAQVKAEDIMNQATSDVGSALQGQIAGVSVTSSSGEPGSEANVQIRGLTSIFGANSPLYVVDGIPFEGDPRLSMEEIETIDVLKDAASTAIYGTRGAAGVILITTKRGKVGQMKVGINSYYGIQNITSGTPIMEAEDRWYTQFLLSWAQQQRVYGNTWTVIERAGHQLANNNSLEDVVQNDNAPIQNHSLRVSGGKDGLTYNITANFFSQEGPIIKSGLERFNVRSNTSYSKGKWDIRTGISFRTGEQERSPWGLTKEIIRFDAFQAAIDPDADSTAEGGEGSSAANLSYLGYRLQQTDKEEQDYFDGALTLTYNFTKDLKFQTRASISRYNTTRRRINPKYTAYDWEGNEVPTQQRAQIYNESTVSKKTTIENILTFNKSFGNHNLKFTGVYSAEKYNYSQFWARKFDLFSSELDVLNNALEDPQAGSGTNRWTQDRENTLIGMLGRLQYNYKGKYLLSGSVRRDGSSRFRKDPWGIFPSFSAGWNVSDEDFWLPLKNTVSSFKIRASHGTTGNQGISDYSYQPTIIIENDYLFGNSDDSLLNGAIQEGFANEDVKWETSVSTNFGYDISFLNNKLTFSSDVYRTNKKDMLFSVLLPPTVGGGTGQNAEVVLNVGDMVNQGVELAANYRHKGKWSWNAGITYTKNENTITKMADTNKLIYFDDSTISGTDNDRDAVSVLKEGLEAGAFMLIKTDGIIKNDEELAAYLAEYPGSGAQLGDLRLIDALTVDTDGDGVADAGDGIIDINDRQYMGSGTPEFEMGFNFNTWYKGVDFSMQWFGAFGGEIMNGNKAYAYQEGNHQDLVHQWSPQNPDSNIPVFRGSSTHNNVRGRNDYWLEDGTFVRLRNITLGYSIPKRKLEKIGLSKLRLYVTGQNLITITGYDGFDPEVGNNGLSTRGIDKGTYPISRQVRAGLQLEF